MVMFIHSRWHEPKQTARKTDEKGELPLQSSSGQMLATFANRRSPRFLDSDSDLERAANMFGINTRQSPARGSSTRGSPAWGTKRPATPSSSFIWIAPQVTPSQFTCQRCPTTGSTGPRYHSRRWLQCANWNSQSSAEGRQGSTWSSWFHTMRSQGGI